MVIPIPTSVVMVIIFGSSCRLWSIEVYCCFVLSLWRLHHVESDIGVGSWG